MPCLVRHQHAEDSYRSVESSALHDSAPSRPTRGGPSTGDESVGRTPINIASDLRFWGAGGGTRTPNLLFTRQPRIVHGVLAGAVLAAQVGWVVQPVRFCRVE